MSYHNEKESKLEITRTMHEGLQSIRLNKSPNMEDKKRGERSISLRNTAPFSNNNLVSLEVAASPNV